MSIRADELHYTNVLMLGMPKAADYRWELRYLVGQHVRVTAVIGTVNNDNFDPEVKVVCLSDVTVDGFGRKSDHLWIRLPWAPVMELGLDAGDHVIVEGLVREYVSRNGLNIMLEPDAIEIDDRYERAPGEDRE